MCLQTFYLKTLIIKKRVLFCLKNNLRQKFIIHANIDKLMKVEMIKNLQTSTNT